MARYRPQAWSPCKAAATLGGVGTVGSLTVYGIHAPGNSPGIQTVQGDYNMLGELQIELFGTAPGTGYDQVLLSGPGPYDVNLGGTLTLDWTGFGGSDDSTELWIIRNDTAGTLSGEFSNLHQWPIAGHARRPPVGDMVRR